ncbi:MAG TPA: MFS transporter [Clostridia bacterium]|nr:MFS transporter [Clostridia bacterium]MDD4502010.1 MFS transporter [Clostridia bacterium]HPB17855.1 MFS transporter [Clostridia bacterium]HQM97366.1 MFS transporter [Clostridia bacterium]HQO70491.1 MFS transporter [Clostridia bacterium]
MEFEKSAKKLTMLCWFSYMINYLARYGFSTSMSEMVADGIFDITFAGAVGTAFLAAYGTGQLVNGLIGDKIHPKFMIFIGLVGSAVMNILVGLSSNAVLIIILWCLNGYFCSMLWAPLVRCFSDFLLKKQQVKAGTSISASIPIGNILSYLIASFFLKTMSWRMVFIFSGVIVIAMSFVWLLGMSSLKDYLNAVKVEKVKEIQKDIVSVKAPVSGKRLMPLLIATGLVFTIIGIFFNGILKDGVTLWVPTYVSQFFGTDASVASLVTIILPLFNLVGAYLAVRLFKKVLKNEMLTATVMFMISVVSLTFLFFFGRYSMILAVVMLALTTASMLGANTMFLTFIPLNFSNVGRASSVTGFLDACSYLASAVSGVTIGVVAKTYGWDTTVITWIAVAFLGASVSFFGIKAWKKGRFMLTGK